MSSEAQALSEQWFQAWLDKDASIIERLAADDYLYVGPGGITMDRLAILAVIRSPAYRLDHGVRTDVSVRSLGEDAAIVRHHYRGAGSFEGRAFDEDQRCVMIWARQNGRWLLVMEQCSS
jgi:uncharacterized protein (TIGR02246 family)